mgnify:FL=1
MNVYLLNEFSLENLTRITEREREREREIHSKYLH